MSNNVIKNNDEIIAKKSKNLLERIPTKKNRKQVETWGIYRSISIHASGM